MSKFLDRFQVTETLPKLINEATDYLLLISPYIKLNNQLKDALAKKRNDKNFTLVVVYGKNEDNKAKSLCDQDLEFFKMFSNVEVRYHKRLHAKIYANENNCLLTSMNLHEYSMNENIEFGILTKSRSLNALKGLLASIKIFDGIQALDDEAFNFCEYIVQKSQLEYKKGVEVKSRFFGLIKNVGEAEVHVNQPRHGFCIRTGVQIPFNVKKPYTYESFQSWNNYKNYNYSEKYCHSCGSQAKTSMKQPNCTTCSSA